MWAALETRFHWQSDEWRTNRFLCVCPLTSWLLNLSDDNCGWETDHFRKLIIAWSFLVLCAGEPISINGYVPGGQEQEEEKKEAFTGISSVDVFSLAPFPSRQHDVFLQAPFGPRKNVSVQQQQPVTANYAISSVGQQPITAHCVSPRPVAGHHAVPNVKQQPIDVSHVTSNVRQQSIPAHHALSSGKQPMTGQRVLSSIGQQPITAHRVVSSVGQQAAVGSVSVGPLYSWTLDVRTSFQPRCHQEKP